MAILLPFELALLFLFHQAPAIVFEMLCSVLLTPPFMAIFVAATVSSGATPFLTTRPLTTASLISAASCLIVKQVSADTRAESQDCHRHNGER